MNKNEFFAHPAIKAMSRTEAANLWDALEKVNFDWVSLLGAPEMTILRNRQIADSITHGTPCREFTTLDLIPHPFEWVNDIEPSCRHDRQRAILVADIWIEGDDVIDMDVIDVLAIFRPKGEIK